MAYKKLGDITWSASSPTITGSIYYDYQRSGVNMQYKIKIVLDKLPYSDSAYGYNIFATIKLDGVTKVSAHQIKGNGTYSSSGYTYETGWLTVGNKASGKTTLNVNIYTTSDPDGIDKTYSYSSLYVVPSASTLSFTSTFTLGSKITLTINKAVSSYVHTIRYKFGSASGTIVSSTSESSVSWTPSIDLAQQIPSASSGTGTLTLETYSGSTKIGSKSYTFTAKVPKSIKPTISELSLSDDNGLFSTYGAYVQNYSKLKLQVTAIPNQGSELKTYTFTVGEAIYTSTSNTITVNLPIAGISLAVGVKVSDARGRTSDTYSTNITVLEYSIPRVSKITAYRSNSGGVSSSEGTCFTIKFSGAISSLNNLNIAVWAIHYKKKSDDHWTSTTISSTDIPDVYNPTDVTQTILNIATDSAYSIRICAKDSIVGYTYSIEVDVPAGYAFFRTNPELSGLSFGREAVDDNTLGVAWNAHFDKNVQVDGTLETVGAATFGGNVSGQYISGTWLRSTAHSDLGATPGSYPVFSDGWIYSRTLAEMRADLAAYETLPLTVVSGRLTDLSYTARYYPMLGMCFVRIYGKIAADMNTGYDYNLLNIGSHAPQYGAALAVKCGKDVMAIAQSNGVISLRPMGENITASAGWAVYIAGFWFA